MFLKENRQQLLSANESQAHAHLGKSEVNIGTRVGITGFFDGLGKRTGTTEIGLAWQFEVSENGIRRQRRETYSDFGL